MAQGERMAKAVLAAAIAWIESQEVHARNREVMEVAPKEEATLREAVNKYKEAMAAKLPGDPTALNAWTCPHCGAERPAFGWHYNLGDTGPFALQWITCFCAECKNVLSVSVVAFQPKAELAEQLKAQFAAKLVSPA